MQVKIGNKIYNSDYLPIMLLLSDKEKNNISNMSPGDEKYCSYNPEVISAQNVKRWMEMSFINLFRRSEDEPSIS